jgi:hypothetical protein
LAIQVKELYGPLLAVVTASKSAFDAMVKQHSPDRTMKSFISAAQTTPESKEGQTYRCAATPGPSIDRMRGKARSWQVHIQGWRIALLKDKDGKWQRYCSEGEGGN